MIRIICLIASILMFCSISFAGESLRVALVEGQKTVEISCEDDFRVTDLLSGKSFLLPAGKYFLRGESDKIIFDEHNSFGGKIEISEIPNKSNPRVNKKEYYGDFRVQLQKDDLLLVNNIIDVELYLSCVLPVKTMPVWPEEVIKAQAIAARTYVMYKQKQNEDGSYDLSALDEELVYSGRGQAREKSPVLEILNMTLGEYIVDGEGHPIEAVTTSSSGGRTESAANLRGRNVSYLQSVEDFDRDSPDYQWNRRISPALLQNLLEQRGHKVGKLESIRLSPLKKAAEDRTSTGRVRYMTIFGSKGSAKVSGAEIREMLGLNSSLFDIQTGTPIPDTLKVAIENDWGIEIGSKEIKIKVHEEDRPVWRELMSNYHFISGGRDEKITFSGYGKGSGLGLSAWGARGMTVVSGQVKYQDILAHYYPGTRLKKEK